MAEGSQVTAAARLDYAIMLDSPGEVVVRADGEGEIGTLYKDKEGGMKEWAIDGDLERRYGLTGGGLSAPRLRDLKAEVERLERTRKRERKAAKCWRVVQVATGWRVVEDRIVLQDGEYPQRERLWLRETYSTRERARTVRNEILYGARKPNYEAPA